MAFTFSVNKNYMFLEDLIIMINTLKYIVHYDLRELTSASSCRIVQVDKQEKKKKKTGRAKRRIQYNRRFVNVVPTFGKKKGPNANS